MVPEEISNQNQITPDVAEKKVSEAVDDVVLDDDFLIEEDGDFFWVIQRISWGIIKTLFVLAIISVLIWLVWGGKLPFVGNDDNVVTPPALKPVIEAPVQNTNEEEKSGWFSGLFGGKKEASTVNKPKVTPAPTPPAVTPAQISQTPTITNRLNLESLAYQLASQNVDRQANSTIEYAALWLRDVKSVGDVSSELLRTSNPLYRAQRIEDTILQAENLLNQSSGLQRQLSEELNIFLNRGQGANEKVGEIDTKISQALAQFEGREVESLLNQKVEQQQIAAENLSRAKVRQTLLQNVQNFDRLLRQKSIPLLQPTELNASPR